MCRSLQHVSIVCRKGCAQIIKITTLMNGGNFEVHFVRLTLATTPVTRLIDRWSDDDHVGTVVIRCRSRSHSLVIGAVARVSPTKLT